MSFWNNPSASFEGLAHDPWHSMQNFGTTGLVPLIPAVAGVVGGIYGGPAGAVAAGSAAQGGVDYFGGNSDARTGKGIGKSLAIGGGKGYLGSLGADYFGGGAGDAGGSFGGDWFSQLGSQGSSGAGDVFSGWSPTGSDASYSSSQLNPSEFGDGWSSAGFNGGDSGPTGSSSYSMKDLNNPATRSLLSNLLKSQQGASQQNANAYNSYKPMNIARQPDFLPTSPTVNVQDKPTDLAALIKALRG